VSGLFSDAREDPVPGRARAGAALFIAGVRCANSAALFWPRLIREALELRPECTRVELSALTCGPLSAELLHPESALQRDIVRLLGADLHAAMRRVLAEMEAAGPPGAVTARLYAGRTLILEHGLPLDCLDAEILPYLMAWPLEWAGIPESRWNDGQISAAVVAEDRTARITYRMRFDLAGRHLSEGLYDRRISVQFEVEPAAPAAGAANTTAP
jgi:hypothetical protein